MRIDTHQHFWKLDRGDYSWLTPDLEPLYRDFLPEQLKPLLDASGIGGTIAVQAADSEAETEYLLELADQHDWILGVVGWSDLEADSAPASIARLAAHPKLVGLRPMIQDIPDDTWMLRDSLRDGLAAMVDHNVTFDALVMPRHLPHLQAFIRKYPDLRIVVDHCAKPEIRNGGFDGWAADIVHIAAAGPVFCKLSGLATEAKADWQEADLSPYIEHICKVFSPEQLIFGSDWPVLNLASDYRSWAEIFERHTGGQAGVVYASTPMRAYPRLVSAQQDQTGL